MREGPLETDPLLVSTFTSPNALHRDDIDDEAGETFDSVPPSKRKLGLWSAITIIFNRVVGTGIFATPSLILRSSGSVGMALSMWALGSIVAFAGTAVFVELGTGLPRSGGEKVYIEYVFRRPALLASCVFIFYALVVGSAAANSVVFGEYVLHAFEIPTTPYNTRAVAIGVLMFVALLHGTSVKWGVRLQTTLAIAKFFILAGISLAGLLCLAGVPQFSVRPEYDQPQNFKTIWSGGSTDPNAFVTGIYSVIWSYIGYAGANSVVSELHKPVQTIKKAAPTAMAGLALVYFLVNVSYFAVVSKEDIIGSERIAAALFFRNLFGPTTEKIISAIVALSVLGNLLAGQFTQSRVIQELGREGILPYSWLFSSNEPFNAPLAALLTQLALNILFIVGPPPGDAYVFILSLSSYCTALVNVTVSLGLLLLYTRAYRAWNWDPPFRAWPAVTVFFFLSNVFLVTVPMIPPAKGKHTYEHLPYWTHVLAGALISLLGVAYWYLFTVYMPWRGKYRLEKQQFINSDGVSRQIFVKKQL